MPGGISTMVTWSAEIEAQWVIDSRKWRGKILTGEHRHWCDAWDGLPVDETCPEWPCECYNTESGANGRR